MLSVGANVQSVVPLVRSAGGALCGTSSSLWQFYFSFQFSCSRNTPQAEAEVRLVEAALTPGLREARRAATARADLLRTHPDRTEHPHAVPAATVRAQVPRAEERKCIVRKPRRGGSSRYCGIRIGKKNPRQWSSFGTGFAPTVIAGFVHPDRANGVAEARW
jgi:hypothetical protein